MEVPTCSAPNSNTFDQGLISGSYFDICYFDRDDIETVIATHNYRSATPYTSDSYSNYSIKRIGNLGDCHVNDPIDPTSPVALEATDPLSQAPEKCGSSKPNPYPNPDPPTYLNSIYGCDITVGCWLPSNAYTLEGS